MVAKVDGWKRLALISTCFGAGFGVVVLMAIGAWNWYSGYTANRLKTAGLTCVWSEVRLPDPPPYKDVIDRVVAETDSRIRYGLKNNTPHDITLHPDQIRTMAILPKESLTEDAKVTIKRPQFFPSGRVAVLDLVVNPPCDEAPDMPKCWQSRLHGIEGFILFAKSGRYEIRLPKPTGPNRL